MSVSGQMVLEADSMGLGCFRTDLHGVRVGGKRVFRVQEKTRKYLQGPRRLGVHRGVVSSGSGGESGSGFQTYQVTVSLPVPLALPHTTAESLAPGESVTAVMGINFCDSTQAANFQLWCVSNSGWGGRVG